MAERPASYTEKPAHINRQGKVKHRVQFTDAQGKPISEDVAMAALKAKGVTCPQCKVKCHKEGNIKSIIKRSMCLKCLRKLNEDTQKRLKARV